MDNQNSQLHVWIISFVVRHKIGADDHRFARLASWHEDGRDADDPDLFSMAWIATSFLEKKVERLDVVERCLRTLHGRMRSAAIALHNDRDSVKPIISAKDTLITTYLLLAGVHCRLVEDEKPYVHSEADRLLADIPVAIISNLGSWTGGLLHSLFYLDRRLNGAIMVRVR